MLSFEKTANEKTEEKHKEKPHKVDQCGKVGAVDQNVIINVVLAV